MNKFLSVEFNDTSSNPSISIETLEYDEIKIMDQEIKRIYEMVFTREFLKESRSNYEKVRQENYTFVKKDLEGNVFSCGIKYALNLLTFYKGYRTLWTIFRILKERGWTLESVVVPEVDHNIYYFSQS